MRILSGFVCGALLLAGSGAAAARPATTASARAASSVGGCMVLPPQNFWNTDISQLPVDSRSAAWLAHMSTGRMLHPDFGSSFGDGPDYGIPITTVDASHAKVPVTFDYASESDRVAYPLGDDTRIEGGLASDGDRHSVVVDTSTCTLYETWLTRHAGGGWQAGSGAVWSLKSNILRHDGWTSADAAGLPVLPGLLRWAEVQSGSVDHAIRFTTDRSARAHIWPARHDAGSGPIASYPPMGARFRLKASYSAAKLGPDARVVVAAMKKYGLVLADNGSPWFFQGEQNPHWPQSLIDDLKRIPASAFVAVDTHGLQIAPNSGKANQPG
jgi:hypothetical protein